MHACCGTLLLPLFLHGALRPVDVVIPPVMYVVGAVFAPCIIESFTGGSYRLVQLVGSVML